MNKLLKLLIDRKLRFNIQVNLGLWKRMPDEEFLKKAFKIFFGKDLNLIDPQTFNDKLQWLKLHDRNPLYIKLVDKYKVREYVEKKIGAEYLIPLIGRWETFDSIDFNQLPESFVLKCTHDSGGLVVCPDKSKLKISAARKKVNRALNQNYYYKGREWPYKHVQPQIIAEKYMVDESGVELKDYKIFCFGGVPKIIQVHFGRHTTHYQNMYDADWNFLDICTNYSNNKNIEIKRPESLKDMLRLAGILSEGYAFLRVDFYSIKDRIYFGELTFYPASGFGRLSPESWEKTLGSWIDLDLAYDRSDKKNN